jgi:hypothetical protein
VHLALRRSSNKLVVFAALLLVGGQAGAALLNPLAYTSNGDLDIGIGNAVSINTSTGEFRVNGILAFTATIDNQQGAANTLVGIPELAVFSFDNINIGPGVAVTITGDRGLSLLSRGDVTIRSALSVNGGDFGAASVAGGYAGSATGYGSGPGAGQPSTIGSYYGAGGGGYGGAGGRGGGYTETDSLGGAAYPVGNSITGALYGGSGGAAGQNGGSFGAGGGGGGVLEISALGKINLLAPVTSKGGAAGIGANGYGGGGGGSGGSLRIAGQKVTLGPAAVISADGATGGNATGGGGFNAGGGGGGGRVLIQQNAAPLATGASANGGSAIGAALPGANGTVEQFNTYLNAGATEINVRIGMGWAPGLATLARGGDTSGNVFGYFDHVGAGFAGPNEGDTFAFEGLLGGAVGQIIPLNYATSSRTTETITVKSNGGDAVLAVGRGVGPTFATNMGVHPATTINLGSTGIYHSAAFHLILSNASTDLGVDSPLTALSLMEISISGPDATAFSVDGVIPQVLFEQQHANLPIHFNPTEVRNYHATLTIKTDQGAASGIAGQTFTYQLTGGGVLAVPEPATLGLAMIGFAITARGGRRAGLACRRKGGL